MKKLFSVLGVYLLIFATPSVAQHKKGTELVIDKIAAKYRELSTNAEFVKVNGTPVAQHTRFIQPEDAVVEDYSNLRQIALIRHGEPDLEKNGKFSYDEARKFLINYDSVGIIRPDKPFLTVQKPEEVSIFCSSINRAKATANYLFGNDSVITVSPEFREFETTLGKFSPKMRMPIKVWTAAARVKWILGIDRDGIESFSEAKARAHNAAKRLADATEENSKAVLVAHGFLNRYIKEDLEKMGWRVVRDGGNGYFGTTILVKLDENKKDDKEHIALNAGQ
ncbi:histidine phosphatase family protein [Pontibacter cellulosilyticus]|uniref:Histidine phosphatase family protein n=1 Tax=Pontibacter cellulosilyticus TaxID=1720253 RepID=A0A923N6R2_9BACT|nr:histidine phosphatase family protein [Pontibacter cellulosilyticus]MBC5991520.1 histidine phosphatase family protein [Pontibacter cellulosilyticus]